MRVAATAASGVVNAETIFTFQQDGTLVSCPYRGGRIVSGFLVGFWQTPERLHWRYVQAEDDGTISSGRADVTVSRTAAGKLRLVEHFTWESKPGAGTNAFEEL